MHVARMWENSNAYIFLGGREVGGGSLKEHDHLVNLGVAVTVVFMWIFKK